LPSSPPPLLRVEVAGSPGEVVVLGFVGPGGSVVAVACEVTETGRVTAGPDGCVASF
jgi:hypothetical protein